MMIRFVRFVLRERRRLESQIAPAFDPALSQCLDANLIALEALWPISTGSSPCFR